MHLLLLYCLQLKNIFMPKWHILEWHTLIPFTLPSSSTARNKNLAKPLSAAIKNFYSDLAPSVLLRPKGPQQLACVPTFPSLQGIQKGSSEKTLQGQEGSHKRSKAGLWVIKIHPNSLTRVYAFGGSAEPHCVL